MTIHTHYLDAAHVGAEYTPDQIEFMKAMDLYKRTHRRPYPTWSEVLSVVHALGYRKVREEQHENTL